MFTRDGEACRSIKDHFKMALQYNKWVVLCIAVCLTTVLVERSGQAGDIQNDVSGQGSNHPELKNLITPLRKISND